MIEAQELAVWQEHADWSQPWMVEQDYIICRAVALIFKDRFLSGQLAMRGGTILHKGHLAPASRYSEDIDLVKTGDRPAAHIKLALKRVLKPLLGAPAENILTQVTLAIRNVAMPSKIVRQTYIFDPIDAQSAIGQLKVEANVNEVTPFLPIVTVPMGTWIARLPPSPPPAAAATDTVLPAVTVTDPKSEMRLICPPEVNRVRS